jgi:hypothetical protein
MSSHQPPNNRSFYLSLAASTLRFAIIVALVIGGIVVIDQAFPALSSGDGDGGGTTGPFTGGTVGGTGDTGGTGEPTGATGDKTEPSPTIVGVRIAVFNGTEVSGLAGETQSRLEEDYGYIATQDPADAPAAYPVTTIYFSAPKDRVEAEYLAGDFFKKLDGVDVVRLEPGTADIDPSTQLAIFLGNDYATRTSN